MNFEISKTLAEQNPELEQAVEFVDQLMTNTRSGMFQSKTISRVSGLDTNQVVSVLELYEEENILEKLHAVECSNCGNLVSIETDQSQTCSQCDQDLDGEEVVIFKYVASPTTHVTTAETQAPEDTLGSKMNEVPLTQDEKKQAFKLLKSRFQNNKDKLELFLELNASGSLLGSFNADKPIDNLLVDVVNLGHEDQALGELFKALAGDEDDAQRKTAFLKIAKMFEEKYRTISADFLKEIDDLTGGLKRVVSDNPKSLIEGLEKVTGSSTPFGDPAVLIDTMSTAQQAVCQIKCDKQERGTGFLIADQYVLTCYHNILSDDDKNISQNIEVRFGYYKQPDGKIHSTDWLAVDPSWEIPNAPYGEADLKRTFGDPAAGELDFAILKLEKAFSDRLYFSLSSLAPKSADKDSRIFIVGHPGTPQGNNKVTTPLQLLKYSVSDPGFETINSNSTRLVYKASTLDGSSGSPVFDSEMRLLALHHNRGVRDSDGKYRNNRGVPLETIRDHLDEHHPDVAKLFLAKKKR